MRNRTVVLLPPRAQFGKGGELACIESMFTSMCPALLFSYHNRNSTVRHVVIGPICLAMLGVWMVYGWIQGCGV